MRQIKKRLLALVCALALCLPMALPARAYTPEEQYENLMAVIELIKQVRQLLPLCARRQL